VEPEYSHPPVLFRAPPPTTLRRRPALHATLLTATFLTLAISGGLIWEGGIEALPETVDPLLLPFWLLARPPLAWSVLLLGLPYACWVVAILGAHEMGHYLACRFYGIPATLPFFIPGPPPIGSFGAVIRIRGRIPDRRALFDLAAAGPIAGFVVAVPALLWGLRGAMPVEAQGPVPGSLYLGQPILVRLVEPLFLGDTEHFYVNSVFVAGWVGVLVTSLNLFPVGQLDGGHVAYAVSRPLHRWLARTTLVALAGLIVYQIASGLTPTYLLWFAILAWMRDRHPRLLDESTSLGRGRTLIALVLFAMFLLCFIAAPLQVF
jgi:membrane-associated protease RseP (regulator of RpoE activity)